MSVLELCTRIENTGMGTVIRESRAIFPSLESMHVIAIAFVVGGISIVDLRLLGLASRDRPVTRLNADLLPWIWGAFALAAITGILMFSSLTSSYCVNNFFQMKMAMLFLAGLNMLVFHSVSYRSVSDWDTAEKPPVAVRAAAAISLLLWVVIVISGRWIGFTL
ncbi:MAG: DUF6644 family protein [Steroidobacteraceae bacterium]